MKAPNPYPKPDERANLKRLVQSLQSTINPTKGSDKNGPIKAQKIIKGLLLLQDVIYNVEPTSIIVAIKNAIRYLLIYYISTFVVLI